MQTLFDNRQELNSPWPAVKQYAGVWISQPFFHNGLKKNCVETQTHFVVVRDECFGSAGLPVEEVETYKIEQTKRVILAIDARIAELEFAKQNLLISIQ